MYLDNGCVLAMELALVLEFELAVPLVCTMELIIELCAAEAQWSMGGRLFAGRARQLKAVSEDVECVKYVLARCL